MNTNEELKARIAELEHQQVVLVAECEKAITWIDDYDAKERFRAALATVKPDGQEGGA